MPHLPPPQRFLYKNAHQAAAKACFNSSSEYSQPHIPGQQHTIGADEDSADKIMQQVEHAVSEPIVVEICKVSHNICYTTCTPTCTLVLNQLLAKYVGHRLLVHMACQSDLTFVVSHHECAHTRVDSSMVGCNMW